MMPKYQTLWINMGCVLLLMLGQTLIQAAPAEERFDLRFPHQNSHLVLNRGWYELRTSYRQQRGMPIVIAAALSTRVQFATRTYDVVQDPAASGGAYIAFVSELENQFEVVDPGLSSLVSRLLPGKRLMESHRAYG